MNGRSDEPDSGGVFAQLGDFEFSVASTGSEVSEEVSEVERKAVLAAGREVAMDDEVWMLISGRLSPRNDEITERRLRNSLIAVYGYPDGNPTRTINLLVDSKGGSLDSAFRVALFISRYASAYTVYVPRRAKSASTLIALGADEIFMSAFGELGPLDTQIDDPRNPAKTVSALDCYQSVDYVRQFGFKTLTEVLKRLVSSTDGRIPLSTLLDTASSFALGSITPILQGISALDFGGWGRSLKIGEAYAKTLLLTRNPDIERAKDISSQLVYGYTHHPRPIDQAEATRIRLKATMMSPDRYHKVMAVVKACCDRSFVGFISPAEADREHVELTRAHQAGSPVHREPADRASTNLAPNGPSAVPAGAGAGQAQVDGGLRGIVDVEFGDDTATARRRGLADPPASRSGLIDGEV